MDKHSKRNKDKYNPYTLLVDNKKNLYVVEFKDVNNIVHKVEISEKVYAAFDKFELEDISQIHKIRKHIEFNEVYDETLYHRTLNTLNSVEDEVESKILQEELKSAINELSDVQKRRLKKYYFDELTLDEIAVLENTSHQAISKSILKAIEEIRKKIKN